MPEKDWREELSSRCHPPFTVVGGAWARGYACALADTGKIAVNDLVKFLEFVKENTIPEE